MNCKSPLLLVLAILLSACSGAPVTPKPGITEVIPGTIATGTPSEIPATATETLPPTKTATATIEPSPTTRPYHFGLEQNMKVEDCNKLTLNKDGTIPEDYLAQERAWIAVNKPAFKDIQQAGYLDTLTYVRAYNFPLPLYKVIEPGHGAGGGQPGPEQFMVSCATLSDGSLVFGAVINPSVMSDRGSVTAENVPVFHFAFPQASYNQRRAFPRSLLRKQ
jgi:hypothetical protein